MTKSFLFLMLLWVNYLHAADPLAIPPNRTIQLDRIQKLDQEIEALSQKIEAHKAELRVLKDSVTGNFETDARLMIRDVNSGGKAQYFLDNQEITFVTNFDSFLKEGTHRVRVEKKYGDRLLSAETEVSVKPGKTTYVDVIFDKTSIKYNIKLVPHTQVGRAILPVSDIPHLLPGSQVTETVLVVYATRELEPGFKLIGQELVLDGKRLKNTPVGTESLAGLILFEGITTPGQHILEANLRFEGKNKPRMNTKFKTQFVTQPGFKTSLILTNHQKVRVSQESL